MKSFTSSLLALTVFLLPAAVVEAKTYGGFSVGQTFQMKVARVISTKWASSTGEVASPISSNLPKFRKNQKITFRIRAGGKLTAAKGISIPFNHFKKGVNEYNRSFTRGNVSITHNAEISRRKDKALRGNLNFFLRDDSGAEPVYYTVIYKIRP